MILNILANSQHVLSYVQFTETQNIEVALI